MLMLGRWGSAASTRLAGCAAPGQAQARARLYPRCHALSPRAYALHSSSSTPSDVGQSPELDPSSSSCSHHHHHRHRSAAEIGGYLDPFSENSSYQLDDSEYALPPPRSPPDGGGSRPPPGSPRPDATADGWAPRGSDFLKPQPIIPERERAALSKLFQQFEQRRAGREPPAHTAPDFSGMRTKATSRTHPSSSAEHTFRDSERHDLYPTSDGPSGFRPRPAKSPYHDMLRNSSRGTAEQVTQALGQIQSDLAQCESELDVWQWAEENVFPPSPVPPAEVTGKNETTGTGENNPASDKLRPYGINTPYYQAVLVELVVTLRDRFRSPHMAVAMYERMKNVSLQSYVIGCSGMLLREMLLLYWYSFRDYDRVAQTVIEAQAAGVISFADRSKDPSSQAHRTKTSPDELPIRTTIHKINDEITAIIRSMHTELGSEPSVPGAANAQVEEQPHLGEHDLWSPSARQTAPDFSLSSTSTLSGAQDLHDMAASLPGQEDDIFSQVFQEEKLETVEHPSPFAGGQATTSQSLPGVVLHDSDRSRSGATKKIVKTDFVGEMLADQVASVNNQLGLNETGHSFGRLKKWGFTDLAPHGNRPYRPRDEQSM